MADLSALEEKLALVSSEQSLEYEHLAMLECQLAAVKVSLAQHEDEAEGSLASLEATI